MLGLTKREVLVVVTVVIAITAMTIGGTRFVLHRFVLDDPADRLTKQSDQAHRR